MNRFIAIITILFTLWATSAFAAISKVQDVGGATTTASLTLAFGSSVTAGDMIAVCTHTGAASINIADNQGNTYNLIPGPANGMTMWYATAVKAGSTTITLTASSAANLTGSAGEFGGMGIAPFVDGNGASSTYGTGTAIQTSTLSTRGSNPELLFGCGITDTPQTPSGLINYGAGGGTANAFSSNPTSSSSETIVGAWQSVSTSGPFGFQWTVSSSNTQGAIAAFVPNNPASIAQSVCTPNGPCIYKADTMANYINLYQCPGGTVTCQGAIIDGANSCVYNTRLSLTGGGGQFRCEVIWDNNQGAWIED